MCDRVRRFPRLRRRLTRAIALIAIAASVGAANLPAGFVETLVVSPLGAPTAMDFAPDGRLFVCEQTGALQIIKNGTLLATPFVTLSVDSTGERGLLGVAFDPNFASNHFVYVYYTVSTMPRHNRISRFTANGDVAAPGSEVVILDLDNLSSATNHNGGAIHFGPGGKLFAAVGENANAANAQTLGNLLGKVLRINADGTIPNDNPFFNVATGNNRAIWALGLRNPFTFAFAPGSDRMFLNDVGQSTWEEINDGIAGANYGWPTCEGPLDGGNCTPNAAFTYPLYAYQHTTGTPQGCAIVGGSFYDSTLGRFPADFAGDYVFADLCGGFIWRFDVALGTATEFVTGIATPVDLKFGPEGDLYCLRRGAAGAVSRISVDGIFQDGFESGDISAWSSSSSGGGLTVTPAAGLHGTAHGLQTAVGAASGVFVEDELPNDENEYRARFYFDPNSFDPGQASGHLRTRILIASEEKPTRRLAVVVLRKQGAQYSVQGRVALDGGGRAETSFFNITDAPHSVEIDWKRSSSPTALDGSFELWIDGTSVATLTSLDNAESAVDLARLGALSVKSGASGSLYFDEFVSRRRTFIGP